MGIRNLIISSIRVIDIEELIGYSIAIDASNLIYKFLVAIRGRMGQPLKDRAGRTISYISGLLNVTSNLIEKGLKPVYVFDGTPPVLKKIEYKRRIKQREKAMKKYMEALERGDVEDARRYAPKTSWLKDEMLEDAKRLLNLMGVPWVQAPSEGEAQAAFMAKRGDVWAVASEDYDVLLFSSPRLIRNLVGRSARAV